MAQTSKHNIYAARAGVKGGIGWQCGKQRKTWETNVSAKREESDKKGNCFFEHSFHFVFLKLIPRGFILR